MRVRHNLFWLYFCSDETVGEFVLSQLCFRHSNENCYFENDGLIGIALLYYFLSLPMG